ncbi:MAG: hypothetical protein JNL85_17025 [Rubrivivax sp.]|nr:hypothetical protein [Rubrivivax sp.]
MGTSLWLLAPQETALIGRWNRTSKGIVADETCRRIEALVEQVLERVAEQPDEGGWTTLFRDPRDGRFWERTYPEGEAHGGGPPALQNLSAADVMSRYQL